LHSRTAVIGLDEAIATLSIEELDRTNHGPEVLPAPDIGSVACGHRHSPCGARAPQLLRYVCVDFGPEKSPPRGGGVPSPAAAFRLSAP
jgi:hypothetical protein